MTVASIVVVTTKFIFGRCDCTVDSDVGKGDFSHTTSKLKKQYCLLRVLNVACVKNTRVPSAQNSCQPEICQWLLRCMPTFKIRANIVIMLSLILNVGIHLRCNDKQSVLKWAR